MPVRVRKTTDKKPTRRRRRRVDAEVEWPFPKGVGDDIGLEYRKFYIPQDDYYYISFPIAHAVDHPGNLIRMAATGLPFEYSKAPSGCYCYRIHRKYGEKPPIYVGTDRRETVPCVMPGVIFKKDTSWRMHQQNTFPYLFTVWHKVPPVNPNRRVRRRK